MYQSPFYLTSKTSNNAFSFEERKNPKLYVPRVIEGNLADVRIGDEIIFEDYNEENQLISCKGLENLVKFNHPKTDKPIVVVDNHNHVFYFWYEAWHQGLIERGVNLVHIDAHRDTRIPERNLTHEEAKDLKKVFEYTNSALNVGNYIPPAMEEELIGELTSITSERELDELGLAPVKGAINRALNRSITDSPYILNIDLDFWAPEMDYIPEEKSLTLIRNWILEADLITFATSPFFIEQERAIEILHKLLA